MSGVALGNIIAAIITPQAARNAAAPSGERSADAPIPWSMAPFIAPLMLGWAPMLPMFPMRMSATQETAAVTISSAPVRRAARSKRAEAVASADGLRASMASLLSTGSGAQRPA
jgi:hypothetical protein